MLTEPSTNPKTTTGIKVGKYLLGLIAYPLLVLPWVMWIFNTWLEYGKTGLKQALNYNAYLRKSMYEFFKVGKHTI